MNIKILDVSWHRNGVGGAGFYAILFTNNENTRGEVMVASLFDAPGYCSVYSVDGLVDGNIKFANGNSWRGDVYEAALRPLVSAYLKKQGTNRFGPFSI